MNGGVAPRADVHVAVRVEALDVGDRLPAVFAGHVIHPNPIADATIRIAQPLIKQNHFGVCGASQMQAASNRNCSFVILPSLLTLHRPFDMTFQRLPQMLQSLRQAATLLA